jgi:hypothetical protein
MNNNSLSDKCLGELFAGENNIFIDKILLWSQSAEAYVRNSCPVAIGNIARTGLLLHGIHACSI